MLARFYYREHKLAIMGTAQFEASSSEFKL
jgi:hypothetical protein